eukprot:symbB.v1.2.000119.t1/scaffold15.1/size524077/10
MSQTHKSLPREKVKDALGAQRPVEVTSSPKVKSELGIFVRLGLQSDDDIVLDAHAAMEAEPGVLKTHAIEKASWIKGDDKN